MQNKTFSFEGKYRTFFQRKEDELKRWHLDATCSRVFINSIKQAILASFNVAWSFERQKKPHNIVYE